MEKPPELPKENVELTKPVTKPRLSLIETDENTVVKAEGFCFMLTGDGDNEQKETEANKNETTADFRRSTSSVVIETKNEEENLDIQSCEIQETESGSLGPETKKLIEYRLYRQLIGTATMQL